MRRRRLPTASTPTTLLVLPFVIGGLAWAGWSATPERSGETSDVTPGPVASVSAASAGASEARGAITEAPEASLDAREASTDVTANAADATFLEDLRVDVEAMLPVRRWRESRWGVLVTSLDRGDTLFAQNAHAPLAPASNVKLLTTAAALHHLGEDFRYRTFLMTDGTVEGGVLHGDLVLYGTGDPTLADDPERRDEEPLRVLARRLRERGVRVVDGDVVGDGTYFEGAVRPESWGDRNLNEWFATPVAALQYNENVATLRIGPGSGVGRPVRVQTLPAGAPVPVVVRARTVARRTGHRVWAVRNALDQPVVLTGEMQPRDAEIWRRMPVPDPALYAAARLRDVLEEEGIRVAGRATSLTDRSSSLLDREGVWAPAMEERSRPTILAEHHSDPLIHLLWVINRESHNLYAESVVRTLGRVVAGDATFEAGTAVVRDFLVDAVGIPEDEALPLDGSGLSPGNRVSPYALVRLMDHMSRSPHWGAFWSTLPQAGNFRELRRMYGSPAAENLRAKTGTLRSVSALTGMVRARNGERLAFSIVSNDVPSTSAAKAVEDRLGIQLASFWRPDGATVVVEPEASFSLEE